MSIAFSPGSERLACYGYIKGRRPFVQILPAGSGNRLAILEGPDLELSDDGTAVPQLACAWFPGRLIFVCLVRTTVFVRIWNGETFDLQLGWQDINLIDHGTLLLSGDGRKLAVAAIRDPWGVMPRRFRASASTDVPLCVLWDLDQDVDADGLHELEALRARNNNNQDEALAASLDHDGSRLALSFADHTIRIWSVATRETLLLRRGARPSRLPAALPFIRSIVLGGAVFQGGRVLPGRPLLAFAALYAG